MQQENSFIVEVNAQNIQDLVERSREIPVLLLFWTDQMPPSVAQKDQLQQLVGQYAGKVLLGLVDVGIDPSIAQQLGVRAVPTIKVVFQGQLADNLEGPQDEARLRALLDQLTMSSGDMVREQLKEMLAARDYASAGALLQQALAEEPNNAVFKVELADVLILSGDVESARSVLASIPEDTDGRKRVAGRLAIFEEVADLPSLSDLDARLAQDESDLDALYGLALHYAAQADYEVALDRAMLILQTDRKYQDELGRKTLVRIMDLLLPGDPLAKSTRRRMFAFLH